jgi:hypothetical protein
VALPTRPPADLDDRYVDLRLNPPRPEADAPPAAPAAAAPAAPDIDLTRPDLTRPVPVATTSPTQAHVVELVEAGSFARAACSDCGWTGPARRSRAVALKDQHP